MSSSTRAGVLVAAGRFGAAVAGVDWRVHFAAALAREVDERRFFLWIPVAAMGGVALNLAAETEPVLWLPALLTLVFSVLGYFTRARPVALGLWVGLAAFSGGFLSMGLRTDRVAAPVLERLRIVKIEGVVEELDVRPKGARMVIRVTTASDLKPREIPRRVRVTTPRAPDFTAGDAVSLTARLLPPSHAVLPGGYDFARDAYFAGVGAVGSALGAIRRVETPPALTWRESLGAAIDRARNRLALRVDAVIGGDEGAIAAAMVTGKRDFLSADAKDLIREAGIFHIITISGVQMTLVAGIFFWTTRRLLALSPRLAVERPIKKWAALIAMAGAFAYDVCTGSRVGTERALIMTLIVLGAVVMDRRALTMRNLAFAVLAIVAVEPEAILGVSFQLSFAAVAALVAVMESRMSRRDQLPDPFPTTSQKAAPPGLLRHLLEKPGELLLATACATSATASFMAYHFHDLSPYVLIGNPLTLSIIEFFAVPGALLGSALYPLGLDAYVWLYVGAGIKFILWASRYIAAAPGSTLHLRAFAPFALPCLALAVINVVIWRSWTFRALSIAFAALGFMGAVSGHRFDAIIPPTGEAIAVRGADGSLAIVGKKFNAFAAEQWLSADADGRAAAEVRDPAPPCDKLGCIADLAEGRKASVVEDRLAFEEDCARAAVIVTALTAPAHCAAMVFDARRLAQTGAVGLTWAGARFTVTTDRSRLQDRPWSRLPSPARRSWVESAPIQGRDVADPAAEAL